MPRPLPTTNKRNDGYVGLLAFTALLFALGCAVMFFENDGDYQFDSAPKKNDPKAAEKKMADLLKSKNPPNDGSNVPPPAPPAPAPKGKAALPAPKPASPVAVIPSAPEPVAPKPAEAAAARTPETTPSPALVAPEPIRPGFTLPRR